jgi:hypothetical protein
LDEASDLFGGYADYMELVDALAPADRRVPGQDAVRVSLEVS